MRLQHGQVHLPRTTATLLIRQLTADRAKPNPALKGFAPQHSPTAGTGGLFIGLGELLIKMISIS